MTIIQRLLGHLVSCEDVSHLLSQAEETRLSVLERTRVRWHLAVCGMCRAFDKQLRFMREAMRRYRE
ncbi:MAG: anti-sigma factor [Betaproteobacteria bacterium]